MLYISTRSAGSGVSSAEAINLGMVPRGGLFVPDSVPLVSPVYVKGESYKETARRFLAPLLTDYTQEELSTCLERAYNGTSFDTPAVIELLPLDSQRSIMELWHGPTAAFKDVALQIMPQFLNFAKKKLNNSSHTVILVATSGDTGKAALEGFKNCEGISIIVFYPHGGVSEIQRLQMATTDGNNTYVVAVKGNFDDCQTGVKRLFEDETLRSALDNQNIELSSANSINWGRLCPQIVYYARAYGILVDKKIISPGEKINFCIPTGNFGNILAGYYARRMGVPIHKLFCASNKNKILADFFKTGLYDCKREFYRTMSPSMDILISSNLERFLFETVGHDDTKICEWFRRLSSDGTFDVGRTVTDTMGEIIESGWIDEERVLKTIGDVFRKSGYVLDTHTAVAAALSEDKGCKGYHTVIASTASPFKFSSDVLAGIDGERIDDEFKSIERLSELSGMPIHRALLSLREKRTRHNAVIDIGEMKKTVLDIIKNCK